MAMYWASLGDKPAKLKLTVVAGCPAAPEPAAAAELAESAALPVSPGVDFDGPPGRLAIAGWKMNAGPCCR